ncbi:MAG: GWxTD domain-containing protein [Bacteroidota bacterium]
MQHSYAQHVFVAGISRWSLCLIACFLFTGVTNLALGQAHPAWMERGLKAIEESRWNDAKEAFDWIIDKEPDNAEARFHMARVQWALGEIKAADRSIVRALRLKPDHVPFMELQLEFGFPREPLELLRRTRKDELSAKILALDSLSVMANLTLGERFTYEWLDWRQRITVDGMSVLEDGWLGSTRPARANLTALFSDQLLIPKDLTNPADVFSLDDQRVTGKSIIDLSPRADLAYPVAENYLRRALIRDPQNLRAYKHLARLFTTRPNMVALGQMANQMREHIPDDYHTYLFKGYAQHYLENHAIAEEQFQQAMTHMPDSLVAIFADTERLLNEAGLKDKKKNTAFSEDGFWAFRDPRFLTPENERLTEHYARLVYAELQFSEPKLNLTGWDSERGEIYVRYGKPELEYYMSNAIAQCGAATFDQFHIFEYPGFRFVFGNLWPQLNNYVFYSPCSQVMSGRAAIGTELDYVIIAKDNIDEKPDGYEYEAGGKRVTFPYLANAFKGAAGKADVYVPYAVPVETSALKLEQTLSLHAGAFLLSASDGIVNEDHRRVEKVKTNDITMFKEASVWIDALQLEAAPGAYDLSVEFETKSGKGQGFDRSTLDVPNFETDKLQLSDLMLAYNVEEALPDETAPSGMFERNGLIIQAAPWGVFNKQQPLYLYFEAYNLGQDTNQEAMYEVEAVLLAFEDQKGLARLRRRAFRRKPNTGVSVRFTNTTTAPDDGQYFILDTTQQPAGSYVLVMRVTDVISKKTVEAERIILLE